MMSTVVSTVVLMQSKRLCILCPWSTPRLFQFSKHEIGDYTMMSQIGNREKSWQKQVSLPTGQIELDN